MTLSRTKALRHPLPNQASTNQPSSLPCNGADLVLETLVAAGVTQCFGYPGGAIIPLYDALYRRKAQQPTCPLTHFRTTHEQHALHAADGYARVTGKVGIVFLTSGPGATNGVTGIANAYLDSIPMVVIAGQVSQRLVGRDAFQEVDFTGITTPVSKHSFKITRAEHLASKLLKAFEIASSGRPGPVIVEIPKDVLLAPVQLSSSAVSHPEETPEVLFYSEHHEATGNTNYYQLQKATDALLKAKRPVIYAGGGVIAAGASQRLLQLAECLDAPVVNSLMGLGSIPRSHPLSLGLVGMHGLSAANIALSRADTILALGVRFSDRVLGKPNTFAPQATLIRVDLDPTEHGKNVAADHLLYMDVDEALKLLLKRFNPVKRPQWHQEIALYHEPLRQDNAQLKRCLALLGEQVQEACVATDVGQHQMWTAQYFPFKRPRQWLTSGGLGTMGFGVGALLGALLGTPTAQHAPTSTQISAPDSGVPLLVTGDGSLRMSMMELLSLQKLGRPALIVVLNNGQLGMVRQWQHHFCEDRYQETSLEDGTNFVALASAMGIASYRAEDYDAFAACLNDLPQPLNHLVLIDLHISPDCGTYPFVPPDASLESMIY